MPGFVVDKLVEAEGTRSAPIRRFAAPTSCARRSPPGSAGATACARSIDFDARGAAPSTARAKACSSRRCRPSGARASTAGPSCCSPIRSIRPTSAAPTAPAASRSISTPRPRPAICPISTRWRASPTSCAAPAAFFLCSPANPQGAVASADYIRQGAGAGARIRLHAVLRRVLLGDLHGASRRPAACEVAAATPERFKNLVVFNSLSKRSNLPGMRSGFAAGDGDFLETLAEIRNLDGAADAGADAACLGRGLVGGAARRRSSARPIAPSSTCATSCSRAASAIAGRPAASSCGST